MRSLYPATFIRKTVGKTRVLLSKKYVEEFETSFDASLIEKNQLDLFNSMWKSAQQLPFYKEWQSLYDLPTELLSLEELRHWPVLKKDDLRAKISLVQATPNIVGAYRTSGSTGEPFDFPRGMDGKTESFSSQWSYRIGHGIQPFDPYMGVVSTIGGNSLSIFDQTKQKAVRIVKDILANSWKNKGFIATPEDADHAIRFLRFFQPKYMIGYTSGIAAIARRSKERGIEFPNLSKVILTSETIDHADIQLIREALKVDILIEYGASELGVVAGTPRSGSGWPIKVLWWNSLVRVGDGNEAIITTLAPRIFPLINYGVGDILSVKEVGPGGSVISIADIEGRTKDVVEVGVKGGGCKTVSARQLIYLVRDQVDIESVQVVQRSEGKVELLIVARRGFQERILQEIAASISHVRKDFDLERIKVRFIDVHIASARGKRSVVVQPELVDDSSELFSLDQS